MVLVQQLATPFIRHRCQRPRHCICCSATHLPNGFVVPRGSSDQSGVAFVSEAKIRDFVGDERELRARSARAMSVGVYCNLRTAARAIKTSVPVAPDATLRH
jgi:hypothetical protein